MSSVPLGIVESGENVTFFYLLLLGLIPLAAMFAHLPAKWIDRVLYPEQARVRATANQLGQSLARERDPARVLEFFLDGVRDLAEADHAAVYAPDSTLSLNIRSLVSPIDLSGIFFSGVSWNIYQGLYILVQGAVQFGEENDIWGWGRNGSLSCALGFEYRY